MTDGEFLEQLHKRLGDVSAWALTEGRRLVWPRAELRAVEVGPIADPEPDRAAAIEAGYSGNLCSECNHPTRPAGSCELCDNCGATTSCG